MDCRAQTSSASELPRKLFLRRNIIFSYHFVVVFGIRRIHHYTIERQSDGQVKMEGGKKYPGPLELIKHHKTTKDGLVEKPKVPCSRPEGMLPYVWPGVTISDLDNAIDRKYTALYQRVTHSCIRKYLRNLCSAS